MIGALQPRAWKALLAMRARLPHALLVHGPAGTGKRALAGRFAQLLLCERTGEGSEPCGACDACRWVLGGNHPDLRHVEPEALRPAAAAEDEEEPARARPARSSTEILVDQVRALADFVNIGSHRAGLRIALLHPAEDMNAAASNALLKSLEEPPAGAMFLLVSHRPWRLPATIRSRCVAVPVRAPEPEAARAWLAAQGVADPARWLAWAGGAPRRALELASGERAAAIDRILAAVEASDFESASQVEDRESLELLAEVLQKLALDRAFAALAGRPKYFPAAAAGRSDRAGQWLAGARELGRHRQLARHPLNPRLAAAEMLSVLPRQRGELAE